MNRLTVSALAFSLAAAMTAQTTVWDLDSCINYAVSHNLTVKQRAINRLSAENAVTEAKDAFLPSISASASESFSFGRGLTSANTYANRNTSNFQWGVNFSLPLFQGLQDVRQLKYARASLRAIVEEHEAAKDDVTLNVISAYLQVLYYGELHTVAADQVKLSANELARRQAMLDAGKIPEVDLLEARSTLAQDELSVVNAANNRAIALLDLAQLLELPETDGFDIAELSDEQFSPASAEEIINNAMMSNHSILAAKHNITAADRAIDVAGTGYIPRLSFNAGIGSSYYTVSGLDSDKFSKQMRDNYNTYLGFSLNIPIFDAFNTRNSVRRARVQKLNAELNYDLARDNLNKSIRQAYYEAEGARSRMESSRVAVEATELAMQAMLEKYNLGRATSTEYETAKTAYVRALSESVQAKYEYILRQRILAFYNRHA